MRAKELNLYPCPKTDEYGREIIPVKYGYVHHPGDLFVIEPDFEDADEFSDNIAPGCEPKAFVKKYGKWGILNPDGSFFITPQFDYIHNFHDGIAAVGIDYKDYVDWGFITLDGSYLVPPMFNKVEDFHNGYAKVVGTSNTRGFKQPDGSYILKSFPDVDQMITTPTDYDDVLKVGVSLNGKEGFIDTTGKWYDK